MSNDVTTRDESTEVANYDNGYDPYAEAANEMGGDTGLFLKFNGKDGQFVYGQEDDILLSDDDLDEDPPKIVRMAINMEEFRRGWMCWIDEEVKEEKTKLITSGPAIREVDLPDYKDDYVTDDDGWIEVAQVPMRDLETGEQYLFKAASKGAVKGLGKFLKAYSKQYKKHPNEIPVVELDMESYEHKIKRYGTIYNPVFVLTEFMSLDALKELLSDEDEGYEPEEVEEKKPAKKKAAPKKKAAAKKKAAEPEPEPEDDGEEEEEEKPAKRKRPRRKF